MQSQRRAAAEAQMDERRQRGANVVARKERIPGRWDDHFDHQASEDGRGQWGISMRGGERVRLGLDRGACDRSGRRRIADDRRGAGFLGARAAGDGKG